MSRFTAATFKPTGRKRGGLPIYRIVEGLVFEIGYLGSGIKVVVPPGFETDGPSIPAWAVRLLPVHRMMKAAAVHDMMREDPRFKKADGDAVFYAAMCAEGTPAWLRRPAFLAVSWNRSRKQWNGATGCTGC